MPIYLSLFVKETVSVLQPWKPVSLLVAVVMGERILLFAESLLQKNIQSKHSSQELKSLSLWVKKMRKRRSDCWWKCVTSVEG